MVRRVAVRLPAASVAMTVMRAPTFAPAANALRAPRRTFGGTLSTSLALASAARLLVVPPRRSLFTARPKRTLVAALATVTAPAARALQGSSQLARITTRLPSRWRPVHAEQPALRLLTTGRNAAPHHEPG